MYDFDCVDLRRIDYEEELDEVPAALSTIVFVKWWSSLS
jgi:hypothetical protein